MPTRTVTATALSRNLSDFLNQVRYQGITLEIKRGNEIVACVLPPLMTVGYPVDQLDRLLASLPPLTEEEAGSFLDDIHAGIDVLTKESDGWAS